MSQRALLLATREVLRGRLGLSQEECEVTVDGQPLPVAGEWFYAVHPGSWTNSSDLNLSEEYGVLVTVSVRIGMVPWDRVGQELLARVWDGLVAQCEKVRATLHMNYTLMNDANTLIGQATEWNRLIVPLMFLDGGRAQRRSGDWFSARTRGGVSGLSQTLTFGRAVREQTLESMG